MACPIRSGVNGATGEARYFFSRRFSPDAGYIAVAAQAGISLADMVRRIIEDIRGVGREQRFIYRYPAGITDIYIRNSLQSDLRTEATGDEFTILPQKFDDTGADGSKSDKPYGYHFFHGLVPGDLFNRIRDRA